MLPLQVCCVFGSPKTAKVLLANGADPNAGEFPGAMLRTAIFNKHKEMVKILKAAGATGTSELSIAIALQEKERIAELLKTAPNFSKDPKFWEGVFSAAAERGDLETVKAALTKGVPMVYKREKIPNNAFTSAASEGQHEVLGFLLSQRGPKSDPNELTNALWEAVWNSHPYAEQRPAEDFEKCVTLLIGAGAPVKNKNDDGFSHMTAAVFTRNPGGNPRVIGMLAAAGADPNPEQSDGKHLVEEITKSCKDKGCSIPNVEVVAAIEKAVGVAIDREK
jgi:ankyrin repeat protein